MAVEMTGAKYPFGFIAMAHDAVLSIADGITQAGSEATSEVIAAIETSEPKGAMGPVVFRKADHTYMGEMTFINFGGDASADDGLAVHDVVRIPAEAFMEKATPGIPYKI